MSKLIHRKRPNKWDNIQDNNLSVFRRQMYSMVNELVIIEMNYEVVRLIQLIESDPQDYYWEVECFNGETKWITCLNGLVKLKGVINDESYNRMVRIWNLNHTENSQVI